ncbi:fungal-specific transcription factor domain-containing protein [Xylariales sp. PMI_506]|nr:fungal-specific transcription factor domain-containing protein [Xylariales sp. PMI_506]
MSRRALSRSDQVAELSGKRTACTKCHARKVKCSGGRPCTGCVQSACEAECTYPKRDRQLRVSQSYLEELLAENEKLQRHQGQNRHRRDRDSVAEHTAAGEQFSPSPQQPHQQQQQQEEPVRNPVFDDRPWFLSGQSPGAPFLIGEAADASFATRLRQALSDDTARHIARMHYPADNMVLPLSNDRSTCALPPMNRSRLLLRTALRVASEHHHIVLKSAVLTDFATIVRTPGNTDIFVTSKIWALLALGELYSARSVSSDSGYPGLSYFSEACRALQVVQERPSVDSIELILLLALYSMACNRSMSSYNLTGSAMRLCIIMGLHVNVPEYHLSDRVAREHRNRLFWTAYELDRLEASKLSRTVGIHDDDIEVDLPSDTELPVDRLDDFFGADSQIARLKLAKITGKITKSLYARKPQQEPFLQRVQSVLKDLQEWIQGLPEHLRIGMQQSSQGVSGLSRALLLAFNQCMIITTRPVFLYILRSYRDSTAASPSNLPPPPPPRIPAHVQALTDACIKSTRHSFSLLLESWVDGSFLTLDNNNARYLFSVALVLATASVLRLSAPATKDRDDFELAAQILDELRRGGNYAAEGFLQHLRAVRECLNTVPGYSAVGGSQRQAPHQQARQQQQQQQQLGLDEQLRAAGSGIVGSSSTVGTPTAGALAAGFGIDGAAGIFEGIGAGGFSDSLITAGMALSEPSMQAFLSQTDINSQPMDISFLGNDVDSFFWA